MIKLRRVSIEELEATDFTGALVACGYESRARAMAERLEVRAQLRTAVEFIENRVLAFDENRRRLSERGFQLEPVSDREFGSWVRRWLTRLPSGVDAAKDVSVLVDISAFSRSRLAAIVRAMANASCERLQVVFYYSVASFTGPAARSGQPFAVRPMSPELSGWYRQPERPSAAIVGLGYEPERALGAIELIEPRGIWALLPHSEIEPYFEAMLQANRGLLSSLSAQRRIEYDPCDPLGLYSTLKELVSALQVRHNINIVASGPKTFSLVACLLASDNAEIQVTRVSAGDREQPVDRRASDAFGLLGASFIAHDP